MRKTVVFILKAAIAAGSIWFIWHKVQGRTGFDFVVDSVTLSIHNPRKIMTLVMVLALMLLNWLLETLKWKLLLNNITDVSGWVCFRSVLTGVTVSLFTPNRIGEFAGRVLHLEPGVRIKGAIASIIGSMNQLLVTIIAGSIGLLASLHKYVDDAFISRISVMLIITGMLAVMYIYFRIPALTRLIGKLKRLKKITLYTSLFEKYSVADLVILTILSSARYFVFTMQFIMVLQWFGIFISWEEGFTSISLMYFVLAGIPSIVLSELTIRGSVALYFFSEYTSDSTGIIAASSFIWLVNLVIPAVMGALAVFYFRLNR